MLALVILVSDRRVPYLGINFSWSKTGKRETSLTKRRKKQEFTSESYHREVISFDVCFIRKSQLGFQVLAYPLSQETNNSNFFFKSK